MQWTPPPPMGRNIDSSLIFFIFFIVYHYFFEISVALFPKFPLRIFTGRKNCSNVLCTVYYEIQMDITEHKKSILHTQKFICQQHVNIFRVIYGFAKIA
jgi:hypothetical protein